MTVERKLVLVELVGFLTGEISKSEIYRWALSVVVASDYEQLVKNDKLTEQVFQFLIDIEKPRHTPVSTKKILEYFIQCLEGKKEFMAEDYAALLSNKTAHSASALANLKAAGPVAPNKILEAKPPASLGWLVTLARAYALIFLIGSVLLNTISLIKPDLFVKPDEIAPTAGEVWKDASPHFLYAFLMLFAIFVKAPRMVFYGFIPVGICGIFFYWSAATSYALKNGLTFLNSVLLLVFVAGPPIAAFFVVLNHWFRGPIKEKPGKSG